MKIEKDIKGVVTITPITKAEDIALDIMLKALEEIAYKCFGYNSYLKQISKDADSAILELLENTTQKETQE
jgi:hypothetical protein